MDHDHDISNQQNTTAFRLGIGLNLIFIIIEAGAGVWGNSLALLADAGHNLSDVLGLAISWFALWLSHQAANSSKTYGYKSASILGALANAVILLVAVGGIMVESITRLMHPEPSNDLTVIIVASVGVIINGLTAYMFIKQQKSDLNIRGAYLHMAADTGVSVGVVIAGIIGLFTKWTWIDPVISILIAIVILISTWSLLKESLNYALQAVPDGLNISQIRDVIDSQPTVVSCHDLHVWGMSTTETAMTVHIIRSTLDDNNEFITELNHLLASQFKIDHLTIQTELGKCVPELTDKSV